MKKIFCWLFGHALKPYNGDVYDPYCVRCGKHISFIEILRQALK